MTSNAYLILSAVLALSSCASAFFSWGSSEQTTSAPHYYYYKRLPPNPGPIYTYPGSERQHIPTVPVQVPLPAQLLPLPNLHNVQLVPCLCPVSPEHNSDNQQQSESVYVNAFPVQQLPQPHVYQQQQQIQPQQAKP